MVKNANYYAFTLRQRIKRFRCSELRFEQPDGEIGHRPFQRVYNESKQLK